jgi:hypothetical protein
VLFTNNGFIINRVKKKSSVSRIANAKEINYLENFKIVRETRNKISNSRRTQRNFVRNLSYAQTESSVNLDSNFRRERAELY